jgi:hypothetical protein
MTANRKRTITLSDVEWEALRLLAQSKGLSRHTMFRQMAQDALARFPDAYTPEEYEILDRGGK